MAEQVHRPGCGGERRAECSASASKVLTPVSRGQRSPGVWPRRSGVRTATCRRAAARPGRSTTCRRRRCRGRGRGSGARRTVDGER
jgi:hypothetical protein